MTTTTPLLTVILLSLALPSTARAKECDNYTGRDVAVADSLEPLDEFVNQLMEAATKKANSSRQACEWKALFNALDDKLGATPIGVVESWAQKSPLVHRIQGDPDGPASIYHGFNKLKYPLLGIGGIDNSIRVNGHLIGTDKLGHFMAEGLHTYRIWAGKGGSIDKAMAWGTGTEESYYGLAVSGVKSFGDLSANYAGAHFWASIVAGNDPYYSCHAGRWVQIRRFTWKDYVTDAWDEAINCSQFTNSMGHTVLRNLEKKGLTCPVPGTEDICRALTALPDARWYVSPVCWALASKPGLTAKEADPYFLLANGGRSGD